ncbi:hypothetical protein HNR65_002473 [Desulfosalsimonas propionicica]|uniref:Uncharacterized protein n=1 Tax=Desulfosalsimonas propionicica TaxID=332175 RepID=A0A7W0CAK6_9BACT|nr:hypothetical protein [Desulfosalsimonas propionicica]MBA2882132.1 hypothetical protein [Desulfosalsimonas propionicica]
MEKEIRQGDCLFDRDAQKALRRRELGMINMKSRLMGGKSLHEEIQERLEQRLRSGREGAGK